MRHLTAQQQKEGGAHYTPHALSVFVARQICDVADIGASDAVLHVLDPAVGDGELLWALLREVRARQSIRVAATAFDTDPIALAQAEARIASPTSRKISVAWHHESFLDYALASRRPESSEFPAENGSAERNFDLAIANPPYVRTQVLGRQRSRDIAGKFGLKGRVDLCFAFLAGLAEVLRPGGIAGVIVSNRFLTTQAGGALRAQLLERYDLLHLWDLGDTKLFEAAVLPAVLLLRKKTSTATRKETARFTSVYSCGDDGARRRQADSLFDVVEGRGRFVLSDATEIRVTQGRLDPGDCPGDVWRLSTPRTDAWLRCVDAHTGLRFGDVGKIRVGVKTTADKVFIGSHWRDAPDHEQPELLKPLITHHQARRFKAAYIQPQWEILYPHRVEHGRQKAVDLSRYPRSERYLQGHRRQLEARRYFREAGRQWFELWVPQDPAAWKRPKLVFRDISKAPTFWMDLSGAVVNGDCYWMTAADTADERLLWTCLGIANSRFIEAYYDAKYNNKLYAGRRRFMTQYVRGFPLPLRASKHAKQIEECSRALYAGVDRVDCADLQIELEGLVADAFGLSIEEVLG